MLRQNYALLLLLSAWFFSAVFSSSDSDYQQIINSINNGKDVSFLNSLATIRQDFRAYDFSIDAAIPWKDLKESMTILFERQQIYSGKAKEDFGKVEITADVLMQKYRTVTEQMFEWAVMANAKLQFYAQHHNRLKNMTRIKHFTQDIFDTGKSIMYPAVCKLNNVVISLIELIDKLKRIKLAIQSEVDGDNLLKLNEGLENAISKVAACRIAAEEHDLKPCPTVGVTDEVTYLQGVNEKLRELRGRAKKLEMIDLYDLIYDDLDGFASNLDKFVQRHSGGTVLDFETDNGGHHRVRRMAQFDLTLAELMQTARNRLTATEKQRNERFWARNG